MKRTVLFSLFCAVFLFGAASAGFAMDTLNVGLPGDAKSLDPHQSVDNMSFSVIKHFYEALVTVDGKTRELVPVLAEKYEILDEKTYKFYLKKGVKFHNGDEMTADDVVFSFKRLMSPGSLYAKSRGAYIDQDGYEVVDKYTVIVRTKAPFAGFLESMKHPYAYILSKRACEEAGEEYFRNPVGTGPFKFKSWVKGETIALERFDDYHGQKANFKELNFVVLPDDSSRVIALETGKVDMIYGVPANDVERLNSSKTVRAVEAPGLILMHLFVNTQKKPFDDPKVRWAVEYAVNKEAYAQVVYEGRCAPAIGPIMPASTFVPEKARPYPYDPAKARELLKEAGYPDGFTAELWIANFPDRLSGATVLQSMLAEVGIKVNVTVYEAGVFDSLGKSKDYDMAIRTVGMQTSRDAGMYWHMMFHSSSIGGYNWCQLNDPEIDRLIDSANMEMNADKRKATLEAIWDRLDELHPDITLAIPHELHGARRDLLGVEELPDGRQNYLGNLTVKE